MKWWPFLLFITIPSTAYCLNRISATHEDQSKIDLEFDNLYRNAQDQQLKVINSTVNYVDLKDGQMVVYSSGTTNNPILQLRIGTSIYFIRSEFLK